MLKNLYYTTDNVAGLIARVVLGIVILPHGLQKTLGFVRRGWFFKHCGFFL